MKKQNIKKIFFGVFYLFFGYLELSNISFAQTTTKLDMFTPQKQTPDAIYFDNISKPKNIVKSNNLIQKAGNFDVAIGEPLYIEGIVTDAFGVPIDGAIIRIWQTNAAGKYHSLLDSDSEFIDPNFNMSGQAITDNLGRYNFLTIFPGYYENRAPHINLILTKKGFNTIKTEFYFKNHPNNLSDPYYLAYTPINREALTSEVKNFDSKDIQKGKIAIFNITIDGIQKYKGF